ncbi:hypothetical protein BCR32DRAFT_292856 [Anaeromyces robustus]|uniref:Calponin-homology (CH) domain-containing protein n=1 Tax=Anaeromyces robustus TaxID=1754192 RepID=A0A1Y1X8K2_9FUNG|nr:hypothetical protein BCR32DRAFT_292856 [Anaeromyces robustus]|eukprot:ORX82095.1 hypothetical protein BCR32DRAFT_292856 [Anaeromyces robustus]
MSWLLKRVVSHKKNDRRRFSNGESSELRVRNLKSDHLQAQKKTFTRWCNAQLSKVEDVEGEDKNKYLIDDLQIDLQDGIRLLKLLEVLSGEELPKPEKSGRIIIRIHRILNVGKALTFLQSKLNEPLPNIGSEDIVDGNLKLTMGLIWVIILRFKIGVIAEKEQNVQDDSQLEIEIYPHQANMSLTEDSINSSVKKERRKSDKKQTEKVNTTSWDDVEGENEPQIIDISKKRNKKRRSTFRRSMFRRSSYGDEAPAPIPKRQSIRKAVLIKNTAANAKTSLLNWCKSVLKPYVELGIIEEIKDFSKSWQNGVAFLALVHKMQPSIMPEIEELIQAKENNQSYSIPVLYTSDDQEDWYQNLYTAFQIAEKCFGIAQLIDANDICRVNAPDERIVMTYISEFYFAFERNYNNIRNNEKRDDISPTNIVTKNDENENIQKTNDIKTEAEVEDKNDGIEEDVNRVVYHDERTEEDFKMDKEYQVRIMEFNEKPVDALINELDIIIHNYLDKANNFSGWVKETQQVQYQLLWFLYSPPQEQDQQTVITPQPSIVSKIYEPLYNSDASVDILESVINECMTSLRAELENINFTNTKGGIMKRELDREFLLVTEIARAIEKKQNDNTEVSSIATVYATQSSILQHLDRLITHTYVSASNVLQNFVLWVKEWEVVLDCVEEDLLNEEKKDDGRPESLKSEVNKWMQNVNGLVETIGSLLVKREKYLQRRKADLEYITKNSENRAIEKIRKRWMTLHGIVRNVLGDDFVPDISSFIIPTMIEIPEENYFIELEMELSSLSRTLNTEYPSKLDNLHQRVESLVSFVTAEFTRRPLLSRRAFPDLPLGGIAQLARIPTLSSVPPPNLQFSNFPAFVLIHADRLIKSGQNDVLKPLELNVIDTINKQKETVNTLLENVHTHRKESDEVREILKQEEQNEQEKIQVIQNISNEYCRMVKRLDDWLNGTSKDFKRIKEQIPSVLSRLQDRNGNFREADRTWIKGTEDWCSSILVDLDLLASNQNNNDNAVVPSKPHIEKSWNKLNEIIFYNKSDTKKIIERKEIQQFYNITPFHQKVFKKMDELKSSLDTFVNSFLSPSKRSLDDQIDLKFQDLVEQWKSQSKDMESFIETNTNIRCSTAPDEENDKVVFKELDQVLNSWSSNNGYDNNLSTVLTNEEDLHRNLTSLQQRLTQISGVNSESSLSPLSLKIGKFKKYTFTKYHSLSNEIIKGLPAEGKKYGVSRQIVRSKLETLNNQLNKLIELDAEYLSSHSQSVNHENKETIAKSKELEIFINIVSLNIDWIKKLLKISDELDTEKNLIKNLERIKSTSQSSIKLLMSDEEEITNEDSEYLSLAKPMLNDCQQRLKEAIYEDIKLLDDYQIQRNEIISNIKNNENPSFITEFLTNQYIDIHMNNLNQYDDKVRVSYMNAQKLVSSSTHWYNIYRQMFDWIIYIDRTRADTEERIRRYSQGGSRAVPNGLDDNVTEDLIVQCEKDQKHLEDRTKEWKENPRFKKVKKLSNKLLELINGVSEENDVMSEEDHQKIESYIKNKVERFNEVFNQFCQTIRKRKHDVIRLRKVFTEVSQPCKRLLKEIGEIEEELVGVNTIIKNKEYTEESVSQVIKSLNDRTVEVTNKCNDLDSVIKNMSESYPESPRVSSLIHPESPRVSSYKHVSMLLRPVIDSRVFDLVNEVNQKGLILKKKMEKTVSEITKLAINNWENDIIIELQNWIERTQAEIERPMDNEEEISVLLESYFEKYKKYQEEANEKRDLLTQAENKTENLVKTLRSWAISNNSSNNKTLSVNNKSNRVSNRISIRDSFIRSSSSSFLGGKRESYSLPKRISNISDLPSQPDLLHIRFTELSKAFNGLYKHIEQETKFYNYSLEVYKEIKSTTKEINEFKQSTDDIMQGSLSSKERELNTEELEKQLKTLEDKKINNGLIGFIDHLSSLQSPTPTKNDIKILNMLKKYQLELSSSFENIHKQLMGLKRSKKIVEGYIKQSQEVRQWIQNKIVTLNEVNENIVEQTSRFESLKDKYDINDGEEEIKIVFKTEESVFDNVMERLNETEAALKRYTLSYQHLKSHAEKIINDCEQSHSALSKESFEIIKTHQRSIDSIWNNLCTELERLKNISTIRMDIMSWIKKSEEFEQRLWALEEQFEQGEGMVLNNIPEDSENNELIDLFAEFGQVVDETVRSWDYDISRLEEEHADLVEDIQSIELNALKLECPEEINVLNQQWYLNNINESLASLQDTFDSRKDEIFNLSERFDNWELDYNNLEEWINVTIASLNERLNDTNSGYAVITGDIDFDKINLTNWNKSQLILESQINDDILKQYDNVTNDCATLISLCNELLPEETSELFNKYSNEKRSHLYDIWNNLSTLKENEKKSLEIAKQYLDWHQNAFAIEKNITEKLDHMNSRDNLNSSEYSDLSENIDYSDKVLNEATSKLRAAKNGKPKFVFEKINNDIYKSRQNQINQKISEARKLIQDTKDAASRKHSLQEINKSLDSYEKWCDNILYELPMLTASLEFMVHPNSIQIDNNKSVIDVDSLMNAYLEELDNYENSFPNNDTVEGIFQNHIRKYKTTETELTNSLSQLDSFKEKYQRFIRSHTYSIQARYDTLIQRFKRIEKALSTGYYKSDIIKKIYAHDKVTTEIKYWIHNKKEDILEMIYNQSISSSSKILDIENQLNLFENSIDEYNRITDKLYSYLIQIEEPSIDIQVCTRLVSGRKKIINSEWELLLGFMNAIMNKTGYIEKEIELNKMIISISRFIEDIKCRILEVNIINSNDTNQSNLEAIFGRLEGELVAGVLPNIQILENNIKKSLYEMPSYTIFYKVCLSLKEQFDNLVDVLKVRKNKLSLHNKVISHNNLLSNIQQQISELSRTVDEQSIPRGRNEIETYVAIVDSKLMFFNTSISKLVNDSNDIMKNILIEDISDEWNSCEKQQNVEKRWEDVKQNVKDRRENIDSKLSTKNNNHTERERPVSQRLSAYLPKYHSIRPSSSLSSRSGKTSPRSIYSRNSSHRRSPHISASQPVSASGSPPSSSPSVRSRRHSSVTE